tara:strand:- start:11577 stop:13466 length:1890 start_codon:yes stop_codon:yes gene_type:complete
MSKALDAGDDQVRLTYALTDVIVNARITEPLIARATNNGYMRPLDENLKPSGYDRVCDEWNPGRKVRGGWAFNLLNLDQTRQSFCGDMHRNGIQIDCDRVHELITKYEGYSAHVKRRLASNLREAAYNISIDDVVAGDDDVEKDEAYEGISSDESESARRTISSGNKFRSLLYDEMKLDAPPNGMEEADFLTESGLYGTGNAVLLAHMASGKLDQRKMDIINDARIIKRVDNKILSTVLKPLTREYHKSLLWMDDRVRTSMRAFLTAVGRYSSVKPNMTNFGNKKGQEQLPTVFTCPPGRMLIGFDVDQFHIRIMANKWGIRRYIKGFEDGIDPHVAMAMIMVGDDRVRKASGWGEKGFDPKTKPKGGEAKGLRDTAKTVGYAYAYLCITRESMIANAASILATSLKAIEVGVTRTDGSMVLDGFGVQKLALPYIKPPEPGKPPLIDMVTEWVRRIYNQEKDWNRAWDKCTSTYESNKRRNNGVGFMESYYFHRRSGNLTDGKAQEVVNYPILSSEQDIMALMEFQVMDLFLTSWKKWNPMYLLQVHDAMKLEVDDPAGPNAPRCRYLDGGEWKAGHSKAEQKSPGFRCKHCEKRMELVRELEHAATITPPGEIAYTVEGHWGWNLGDI